ncbi:MAG: electron-transfer flavoprotein:ubiquinone oxidoreductase [Chloroflexota bacterium]
MADLNEIDALFVGAGPASLAGAIKLKQLLNQKGKTASVVVIEKAERLGQHNLSGAVFEAEVLDELVPGWREKKDEFVTRTLANIVKQDEVLLLAGETMVKKIPEGLIPSYLHHKGNYVVSLSEMVNWLAGIARGLGVEIYTGFAAKELLTEGNAVKGVKLGDKGLDKERKPQSNYLPGDVLSAKVTVLGEGSLGQLAEEMGRRLNLRQGRNPQIHSLGVKEIIRLPEKNNFGANHVVHTLGFPNKADVFGGGTLYSMGNNQVAVALIMALDWKYCDLNPQHELQIFKSHRLIQKLLEGGEVVAYGAKTLPEGGYYSRPELVADGALIIGDDAGLTNVRKLKGLHYAIKSGMLAGEAIAQAIEKGDFAKSTLNTYEDLLVNSFIERDLHAARNYRQVFHAGLYMGLPLSLVQKAVPGALGTEPNYKGMRRAQLNRKYNGGLDRPTDVSFSGTIHREDEPAHITLTDLRQCEPCKEKFGCHPCQSFCPGEVYSFEEDKLILSPSNCVHCQTCRVKCPMQVIKWEVPEGGDGPRYKIM